MNGIKLKAESLKCPSDDWLQDIISSVETKEDAAKKRALEYMHDLSSRILKIQHGREVPPKRPTFLAKSGITTQKSAVCNDTHALDDSDNEFSLREYDSDEGEDGNGSDCEGEDKEADLSELQLPKIFYCSRTHSQIAQFVSEIRRTEFASVRCISLGSRRNMCINPAVNSLSSDAAVSERCLDMMRQKKSQSRKISLSDDKKRLRTGGDSDDENTTSSRCAYHCGTRETRFMEHALGKIRDIEDLVSLGEQISACPYYGSRKAVAAAQVICLPYTMMLQQAQRQALGISLKGNVVIFDEAHNIVDATNSTHSALLLRSQVVKSQEAVKVYLDRFRAVLTAKNFYYITLLGSVLQSFKTYLTKKEKLLNARRVNQAVTSQLNDVSNTPDGNITVCDVNSFVFDLSLDNINLLKLLKHASVTQLVEKVSGFAENKLRRESDRQAAVVSTATTSTVPTKGVPGGGYQSALRAVLALLQCLGNKESDGRLFIGPRCFLDRSYMSEENKHPAPSSANSHPTRPIKPDVNTCSITTNQHVSRGGHGVCEEIQDWAVSFVLMNPASHFKSIADEARSVLLVGGTLQPFGHLSSQLFPHIPCHDTCNDLPCSSSSHSTPNISTESKEADACHSLSPKTMMSFACGHIVSPSHVLACAVSTGVGGISLDFRHSSRHSPDLVKELGDTLIALLERIPHGVVVFFTSYAYMEFVIEAWKKSYTLQHMRSVKPVYIEHRAARHDTQSSTSSGTGVESIWSQYSATAMASARGACLFSVMGGKLSEGINFSDNLARAVVVVGLPYPDVKDPVLREKMNYADACRPGQGRDLYEAMCMKSVNQSIGRSIRHANDYACVMLLDARYNHNRIVSQLPLWISQRLLAHDSFAKMASAVDLFFSSFAHQKQICN